MPSEQVVTTLPLVETHITATPQIKLCGTCHSPLTDTPELVFVGPASPGDVFNPSPFCGVCAERARSFDVFANPLGPRLRRQSTLAPMVEEPTEYTESQHPPATTTTTMATTTTATLPAHDPHVQSPQRMDLSPLTIGSGPCAFDSHPHSHSVPSHHTLHSARSLLSPDSPPPSDREHPRDSALRSRSAALSEPDPYADVTRLRLNNTRQDCLYPGASFVGIQKSGRNSYNVSVTIVVGSSPFGRSSMSTFRAQRFAGTSPSRTSPMTTRSLPPTLMQRSSYGFLTQSYGASEMDDMTHWGRFDSFRGALSRPSCLNRMMTLYTAIKSEMRRPGLTIRQKSLSERGFVFMRWKERFLVPEHQVRGIRGASYDGKSPGSEHVSPSATHSHPFREPTSPVQSYHPLPHLPHSQPHHTHSHVPPTRTRTMSSASANSARSPGPMLPEVLQSAEEFPPLSPTSSRRTSQSQPPQPQIHTQNLNHRATSPTSPRITRSRESFSGHGGGRGPRTSTATMTGFYFHQNSEPSANPVQVGTEVAVRRQAAGLKGNECRPIAVCPQRAYEPVLNSPKVQQPRRVLSFLKSQTSHRMPHVQIYPRFLPYRPSLHSSTAPHLPLARGGGSGCQDFLFILSGQEFGTIFPYMA
ncbi:vacuolar import and degradation domain-containing protein [Rhizoctonia solani AG-1 IA]|uniref:Vacuolar import and degradation domain-containing protein n=1 Tax=Thanatephorus cucumeris (strain AG1-IA) TaxID=983506 RepID=L8X3A9_THACA|nr:vacuolar import and degradation domain-containing protein [Rhizoctonia solani AG-1 IA]